ncbi:DUF3016 domain-containing protein [Acidovorax sp. SUPP2825]|uniref:DUF3016 domain-containing protein n=1 Tax=Acidovorax sp. SUPP2825 TaxID=2920879 RepID=UPI0023DE1FAE|nr:DUF3016 domain-containing protein [Acidovorax sp. SUPP2825]GKS93527.1 DUF3016 domain-containing protein [Acidovorax sp. SUPP2825]
MTHHFPPRRRGATARAAGMAWPGRGRARASLALLAAAAVLAGCAGGPPSAPAAPQAPVAGRSPAPESARPAAPGPGPAAARGAQAIPPGIVSVEYDDPSRFSDARMGPHESDRARRAWVDALCQHLSERAAAALPDGERLAVRITDVQRAGGFEPGRGAQLAQVRIVRDVYPPRIDLEFQRTAADGRVLQSGRRELRDPSFLSRAGRGGSDPLRYEKALLDGWVRQDIGAPAPQ